MSLSIWTMSYAIPYLCDKKNIIYKQNRKRENKDKKTQTKKCLSDLHTSKSNGLWKNCSFFTSSMVAFAPWTASKISLYHSILGRCIPMLVAITAMNSGRKKTSSRRHVTRRRDILPPMGCVSSYLPDNPVRNLTWCESSDATIQPD